MTVEFKRFTHKMRRFCEEYIIDYNATQAAIRAGYSAGKRNTSASTVGCALLRNKEAQEYIEFLQGSQFIRTSLTADRVLQQYSRLAFADIKSYYITQYVLTMPFHKGGDDRVYKRLQRKKKRLLLKYGNVLTDKAYSELPERYKGYYSSEETLKPIHDLTDDQRASIAGITYDRSGRAILKLAGKETSLDALAKYLGLYEKDNKQKAISVNVENRGLDDFYAKEGE